MAPIPLYRPDITAADAQRVMAVLEGGEDATLLSCWEEGWGLPWQRHCLAFTHEGEVWRCLRQVMGWRQVVTDAFISPRWTEAMATHGVQPIFQDLDHCLAGEVALIHHAFGVPRGLPAIDFIIEEISGVLLPWAGCGGGTVQLMHFHGLLQAASSCVLLTRDEALFRALGQARRGVPGAAVCALGMAQRSRLPEILQRRAWLASRYERLLREGRGSQKFPIPVGGRVWEWYLLHCDNKQIRDELTTFLNRSDIGAASPIWQQLPKGLTAAIAFQQCTLALPLYAALTETEQKRVINRYHRWRQV